MDFKIMKTHDWSPPASCFRMSSVSEPKRERVGDRRNIFFYCHRTRRWRSRSISNTGSGSDRQGILE